MSSMNNNKLPIKEFQSSFAQVQTVIEHAKTGLGIHPSAAESAAQEFITFLEAHDAHHFIKYSRASLKLTLKEMVEILPVSPGTKGRAALLAAGWEKEEKKETKPSETFLKIKNQLDHVYSVIIDLDRAHIGGANPQVSSAVSGLMALVKEADVRQISPGESDQIFSMIHLIESNGAEKFKDLIGALHELGGKLPPKSPSY